MQLHKGSVGLATGQGRRTVHTGLGDVGNIVTLEDQLILLTFRFGNGNSTQHVNVSYGLLKWSGYRGDPQAMIYTPFRLRSCGFQQPCRCPE
jgi:hypothetical protein